MNNQNIVPSSNESMPIYNILRYTLFCSYYWDLNSSIGLIACKRSVDPEAIEALPITIRELLGSYYKIKNDVWDGCCIIRCVIVALTGRKAVTNNEVKCFLKKYPNIAIYKDESGFPVEALKEIANILGLFITLLILEDPHDYNDKNAPMGITVKTYGKKSCFPVFFVLNNGHYNLICVRYPWCMMCTPDDNNSRYCFPCFHKISNRL